jgi:hypothetical protein
MRVPHALLAFPFALAVLTAPFRASVAPAWADDESFQAPPPRLVDLLAREIGPRSRIYLSTASWRREVTIADVNAAGLSGVRAREGEPGPAEIPWQDVARLERRTSHITAGRILGAAVGATALGYAGGALADDSGHNDLGSWVGLGVGAVGGAWLGGVIGDQAEILHPLYSGTANEAVASTPTAIAGAPDADRKQSIDELSRRGGPIRVRGSFGEVVAHAIHIDANGLTGITIDPKLDAGGTPPPEPITWSQITSIDRRSGASGRGAALGALLGAVAVGTMAGAISAGEGSSDADVTAAVALGGVAGGLIGGGLGAMVGAAVPVWHNVYRAPAPLASQ